MEKLRVLSPVGGEEIKQSDAARPLTDLNGMTIGEIWNGLFRGDETFPLLRRRLLEQYPGLKIVPYTEFPFVFGGDSPAEQRRYATQLAQMAKAKGCDAVISGNGA